MAPVIEKLIEGFTVAEGPHWDDKNQCLYVVDVKDRTIHKYVPSTKKHTKASVGDNNVSIIIPVKGRKDELFVITSNRSLVVINWDGKSEQVTIVKKLHEVEPGTDHRFNDGKCDKTGRIWTASMSAVGKTIEDFVDKQGTLFSFQKNIVKKHRSEIGIANGIAFDYKINKMYYVDSLRYGIDQYDIDFETGTLSNQKTIFSNEKNGLAKPQILDGMTIDSDGNLWVAVFNGGRVYQINPKVPNTVLQYIEFPAKQITSVAFGGPSFDELYVTSANLSLAPQGESPGSVFRVTGLNVKGLPADEAVI